MVRSSCSTAAAANRYHVIWFEANSLVDMIAQKSPPDPAFGMVTDRIRLMIIFGRLREGSLQERIPHALLAAAITAMKKPQSHHCVGI